MGTWYFMQLFISLKSSEFFFQGKCGFFDWCDTLSGITVRTPLCPCGAGICSVNKASSPGPNGEKWYFACRIKKVCAFSSFISSYFLCQ